MLNIGNRPTISGELQTIEVNIFNFNHSIYGEELTLKIYRKIRDEKKFNGLPELKSQLNKDKQDVLKLFDNESI